MGKIIKYIVFALFISLVLLVFRFPYSAVEERVVREFSALFTPVHINVSPIKYNFPRSLKIESVTISGQSSSEKRVIITNVVINPSLKNPFNRFGITAELLAGDFSADLVLDGGQKSFEMQDLNVSGVSCDMVASLIDKGTRFSGIAEFAGRADGTMVARGSDFRLAGDLAITNGYYRPEKLILGKDQVDFNRIDLSLNFYNDTITIEKGSLDNNQLTSGFAGSMQLSNPWPLWLVDILGEIEPKKNLFSDDRKLGQVVRRMQRINKESNIPYSIIGTAENANFRVGRNR